MIDSIKYIMLIFLLFSSVMYDVRTFRIPNSLTLSGCITGLIHSSIADGVNGLFSSILGIVIPVIILFVLFIFNLLGAGDIKLFAAIGSFLYLEVIYVIIASFVVAAMTGILIVLKKLIESNILKQNVERGFTKIHMSVSITLGTLAYLIV